MRLEQCVRGVSQVDHLPGHMVIRKLVTGLESARFGENIKPVVVVSDFVGHAYTACRH